MKASVFLTKTKFQALQAKLSYMEGEGNKKLSILLASSPSSGMGRPQDSAAHELAATFQGEVNDIRSKLGRAIIIEEYIADKDKTVVEIGSSVQIKNSGTGQVSEFLILGPDEVEPSLGIISFLSPLGSELLGKREGQSFVLRTTRQEFTVKTIQYKPINLDYKDDKWEKIFDQVIPK